MFSSFFFQEFSRYSTLSHSIICKALSLFVIAMKNVIHCYFFISGCVKAQTQGRWMLEPALLPKNVERRAGLQLEIVLPVLEFVANSRRSYTFLNKIAQ